MEMAEHSAQDVRIVELSGRLDTRASGPLGDRINTLLAAGCRGLVLDLGATTYVSSAGLRVLLLAMRQASQAQSNFVLSRLSAEVARLIDLGGFDGVFTIAGSRDDAIAAARG